MHTFNSTRAHAPQRKRSRNKQTQTKGLDVDALFISHIQVNKAIAQRRRTYRAHGRIGPYMSSPCHVELIVSEKEAAVKAEAEGNARKLSRRQAAKALRSGAKSA